LYFIPVGWTDELQPLDRYVFGALKAVCRRLFTSFCHEAGTRVTKPDAVAFLREDWDCLNPHVVEKGWGVYEDICGDRSDSDFWADDEFDELLDLDAF
jgi:hypothetical protein